MLLFVITFVVLAAARYMLHADRTSRDEHEQTLYARRRRRNGTVLTLSFAATALGLGILVLILGTLVVKSFRGLSLKVFTEMTPAARLRRRPAQPDHGQPHHDRARRHHRHADRHSAGTYMAEYGRFSKVTHVIRFINDILLSAPSIIIGLFVYELVVAPMGHFSGFAGSLALACW